MAYSCTAVVLAVVLATAYEYSCTAVQLYYRVPHVLKDILGYYNKRKVGRYTQSTARSDSGSIRGATVHVGTTRSRKPSYMYYPPHHIVGYTNTSISTIHTAVVFRVCLQLCAVGRTAVQRTAVWPYPASS